MDGVAGRSISAADSDKVGRLTRSNEAKLDNDFVRAHSNGLKIVETVLAGDLPTYPATPRNVADFTLALHAKANLNGEKMLHGAFSVSDSDGRLAKWLDTSAEVYLRASTHIKSYQKMTVDGHLNVTRGIDIPEGVNGFMAGMRTVNYGTIPDLKHLEDAGGSGPNRRLYIKCETHGCRYNAITAAEVKAGLAKGMKIRPTRTGDWPESLRHTFSYLETRGADPTPAAPARNTSRKT